jgi:adenosylcobinamide-GDP ribazoletransferase
LGALVAWMWVGLVAAALVLHEARHARAMLVSLLLALAGAAWCARWLNRRLGGYTGDTLGAAQQITEVLVLLGWLGTARAA